MTNRIIDLKLRGAIVEGRPLKSHNTIYSPASGALTLHGNLIARRQYDGAWLFSFAGFRTNVTRDRINCVRRHLGLDLCYFRAGQILCGDRVIDPKEWFK